MCPSRSTITAPPLRCISASGDAATVSMASFVFIKGSD
jgi:hypothetical protein